MFDDKINSPDTADISAEDHGHVQMNVGILELIEHVKEIGCKQEHVQDLSQNNVSSFFIVEVSTSEDLVYPDSKTTPNNEEIAKFDKFMQFVALSGI